MLDSDPSPLQARLTEQHSKTPVTESVTATGANAKDADRVSAIGVQKSFGIRVVQIDLTERATGLEPATSSLGSWHSTN
jgi:hypothetical protein